MDDQVDDQRREREVMVMNKIIYAFKRLSIDLIYDDPVMYDDENGEAHAYLDDTEISLTQLIRLKSSGLSDDYVVQVASDMSLAIRFIVSPSLRQSKI